MAQKLFSTQFFACLVSSETGSRFSLSDYFENAYGRDYDFCNYLPYELCHRRVSVASPFSYETARLDALCIVHTTKGAGRLYCETADKTGAGCDLTKGTLAVIDCRKMHKLVCQHNIWEYTICFTSTAVLEFYLQKILSAGSSLYRLDKYPDVLAAWEQVLHNDADDEIHGVMRSRELINLFTQLYLVRAAEQSGSRHVPSYIADMHKKFHDAYDKQYSLDELAAEYGVNKYRLCREFTKYYEYTPIQYLNRVRIDKAKELLLGTDEKIVEIGQMVGIENTNHFIRLFKEKTGVTPLAYRRGAVVVG